MASTWFTNYMNKNMTTIHWYRSTPQGVESGPFSDEERAEMDGVARRPIFWRTERVEGDRWEG